MYVNCFPEAIATWSVVGIEPATAGSRVGRAAPAYQLQYFVTSLTISSILSKSIPMTVVFRDWIFFRPEAKLCIYTSMLPFLVIGLVMVDIPAIGTLRSRVCLIVIILMTKFSLINCPFFDLNFNLRVALLMLLRMPFLFIMMCAWNIVKDFLPYHYKMSSVLRCDAVSYKMIEKYHFIAAIKKRYITGFFSTECCKHKELYCV